MREAGEREALEREEEEGEGENIGNEGQGGIFLFLFFFSFFRCAKKRKWERKKLQERPFSHFSSRLDVAFLVFCSKVGLYCSSLKRQNQALASLLMSFSYC